MDKLEEEILRLAVERGLIHPDELKNLHTPDLLNTFVEQGKISTNNVASLKAELLDDLKTLADPIWGPMKSTIKDQKEEISIAVFGRFIQLQPIGQGGMARVYKAFDPTLGRSVALKILYKESERLMLEARNQARVEHENVCNVYEVGEVDGKQYICMQYVQGKNLSDTASRMNLTEKVEVIQSIADAVHAAHKNGLIHRDIKPSNIMLEKAENGRWKPYILDFGLARMQTAPGITHQGVIIGTPHYMPPEQARGAITDMRSDVYSLGATLYELIAGKPPFVGTTPEVLLQVLQDDVVPIQTINRHISADLKTIVMKCLDKDPAVRYQSASALADDLKRYLDGEPILARSVSMSTKVWKKAKKNRLATLIFGSALVITVLLLSMLIFVRWKASVQAQYENEFGEEIRYIETMLLSTYTAPIHDVRPKLNLARNRLLKIEQRIQKERKWAYGPGNNALGQGYLMSKEYERSEEFLKKAWDSGYRNPSTAYALGKVKGILWRQALVDSDTLATRSLQEEAKSKADERFRRPAIQFLKDAREYAESPAYVEALIFLYEKRHNEAFEKSREALKISSRPYEVLKLQGDIHFEIAKEAITAHNSELAMKALNSAGEAYASASEFARSDQDIYLADAERWTRLGSFQVHLEEKLIAYERAISACDKASVVQPDNERPYLYKSGAYLDKGVTQIYSSGNPKPAILMSVEMAREASKRNPKIPAAHHRAADAFIRLAEYETANSMDPRKSLEEATAESLKALKLNDQYSPAYVTLASAYFFIGEYELTHGGNPLPPLQKVIDIIQKNLRTFRRDDFAFNLLGLAYLDMGDYRFKRGEDPRPDLSRSIESYESGLKINPASATVAANMGLAFVNMAKYEMNYGIDPAKSLQQSLQKYDQCLSMNKTYAFGHHDRGSVYLLKAEHKLRIGENPTSDLAEAMISYKKSLEINPELSFPHISMGQTYLLSAIYSFKLGKDPTIDLNAVRKSIEEYITKDDSYYEAYRIRGAAELLEARWSILKKREPKTYLERSITNLRKSIQLNKNELSVFRDLASTYRYQAEWKLSLHHDATESIDKGLEAIESAVNLSSSDPETMALYGSLKLLQARQASDVSKRAEYTKVSFELLNKAITANPFLKLEYEPLKKQAENIR